MPVANKAFDFFIIPLHPPNVEGYTKANQAQKDNTHTCIKL
jgi:hypothetical protein